MPFSQEPFRDPANPLFEQRMNELEKGEGAGQITTAKIAAEAVTGEKIAPSVPSRRVLLEETGSLTAAAATGVYFFLPTGAEMTKATALKVEYTTGVPFFWIKALDYEIPNRTTKLTVELSLLANAKASGATFTAGLYEAEKIAGATGKVAVTYKLVASTTAAIVAPAIETAKDARSTAVTVPTEGAYVLGVETTVEALKAESQVALQAALVLFYT